jgi:hypothetical protein
MIAAGGLSGGISSVIAGGNFWKGVRQGVIVAGLNHLAHALINPEKYTLAGVKQKFSKSHNLHNSFKINLQLSSKLPMIFILLIIK